MNGVDDNWEWAKNLAFAIEHAVALQGPSVVKTILKNTIRVLEIKEEEELEKAKREYPGKGI